MTIDSPPTLDAALRRRAAELPDHVVYRYLQDGETESHQLTYAGLDRRARALAARLQMLGQPGQPVLVFWLGWTPLSLKRGQLRCGCPFSIPEKRKTSERTKRLVLLAFRGCLDHNTGLDQRMQRIEDR